MPSDHTPPGASSLWPPRSCRPPNLPPSLANSSATPSGLSLKCNCGRSGPGIETGQLANALPDHDAFRLDPSEQNALPQCSTGQCHYNQQANTSIPTAGNCHQVQQPRPPRKRAATSQLSQHAGCRDSPEDRPIESHGVGRATTRDFAAG